MLLDLDRWQAQRRNALQGILDAVDGSPDFQGNLDGCLPGRSGPGGDTAYGLGASILDWAERHKADPLADRALAWLKRHAVHVADVETWHLGKADQVVPGEYVRAHPARSAADPYDSDPLRHWWIEPYARLLKDYRPFPGADRVLTMVAWWAYALMKRTDDLSYFVRTEGSLDSPSRINWAGGNLVWAYLALGEKALLERAETLMVLAWSMARLRGPTGPLYAPVTCYAGSDHEETPSMMYGAADRSCAPWSVGSSAPHLFAVHQASQYEATREAIRRYVLTETALAWCQTPGDVNAMLRGAQADVLELRGPRLSAGEALALPVGARYAPLCSLEMWEDDDGYRSTILPRGRPRTHYSRLIGVPKPEAANKDNWFGWPDLLLARYLLTGVEENLLLARLALRDYVTWRNRGGPLSPVTIGTPTGDLQPWRWGNEGNNRGFAWWWSAGRLWEMLLPSAPWLLDGPVPAGGSVPTLA